MLPWSLCQAEGVKKPQSYGEVIYFLISGHVICLLNIRNKDEKHDANIDANKSMFGFPGVSLCQIASNQPPSL